MSTFFLRRYPLIPNHTLYKHLTKLRKNRAYRESTKRLIVPGQKLINELKDTYPIHTLLYTKEEEKLCSVKNSYLTSADTLKKITGLVSPDGLVAELSLPTQSILTDKRRILALDGIQDPGNLGALARSALAFGFGALFLTQGTVDLFNEKVIRSAKGANFILPYQVGSHADLLRFSKTHELLLADTSGENLSKQEKPFVLILGSEGNGPDPILKEKCRSITIPMTEKTESLNVAVAGSIIMYQLYGP